MRWSLVIAGVAVAAFVVGAAIAGLPETVADDVVLTEFPGSGPETTVLTPVTDTPEAPGTGPSATALGPSTTLNGQTPDVATSDPPTSSGPPADEVATSAASDEQLQVVVANASVVDGVATQVASIVRSMGYPDVVATTASQPRATTVVYFVAGAEGDARRIAERLFIDGADIEPRPEGVFTEEGRAADVLVLVGDDAGGG